MAGKVTKPCKEPGCPGLVEGDGRYCEKHKELEKSHNFGSKWQEKLTFYNSAGWRKFRLYILSKNPICQECKKKFSRVVHHLKTAREFPELRFKEDNVEALCDSCHNKESQRESIMSRKINYDADNKA